MTVEARAREAPHAMKRKDRTHEASAIDGGAGRSDGRAAFGAGGASVTGTYVEARTAEVFAGACIMNGEAATTGREALLAWKVDRGRCNGVALDGLAVVAALAGDTNLGIHEIGGDSAPARAAIYVDARATPRSGTRSSRWPSTLERRHRQRRAKSRRADPVRRQRPADQGVDRQSLRLTVDKELNHDETCGNKQWFHPLTRSIAPRWARPIRERVQRRGARHEVERSEQALVVLRNLLVLVHLCLGNAVCGPPGFIEGPRTAPYLAGLPDRARAHPLLTQARPLVDFDACHQGRAPLAIGTKYQRLPFRDVRGH